MGAVVEHGGYLAGSLTQCVVLDDGEGHTCHGKVLLRTGIDTIILSHVDRTAEDIGRHVGNHANGHVEFLTYLCTIDGVVGGDVEIIDISGACPILGDKGVVGIG